MKIFKIIALLLILTFSFFNCQKQKYDLDYEKKVMNELLIEFIDSLYNEPNYIPPPPIPFPEIYFKTTNQRIKDSIYQKDSIEYIEIIKKFNDRVNQIKNYKGKKVIAISDTIYALKEKEANFIKHQFSDTEFDMNNDIGYRINLLQYSKNGKYDLKYSSEFPLGNEKWKENHKTHLTSVISFSRIQFDRTKKYGVLTGGISYGKLSGNGFVIFLEKKSDKWVIAYIYDTWVS